VPLALVQWMQTTHNTFLYEVDELLLMAGRDVQRSGSQKNQSVSSRFVAPSHMLQHSVAELLHFIDHRCSTHCGSDLLYDLAKAEQYLIETYLTGKPVVNLELRMFEFSSDVGSIGASLKALHDKLDQEVMPPDVEQATKRELNNPADAARCKELVEVAVSFLAATGGDSVMLGKSLGNMPLAHYVRDVLLLPEDSLVSSVIVTRVRLKHLASLFSTLRDLTGGDSFATVELVYKSEMPDDLKSSFDAARQEMPLDVLLPNAKDFMLSYLCNDMYNPNCDMKDSLGCWTVSGEDAELADLEWYETHFPSDVPLKYMVDAYKILAGI